MKCFYFSSILFSLIVLACDQALGEDGKLKSASAKQNNERNDREGQGSLFADYHSLYKVIQAGGVMMRI